MLAAANVRGIAVDAVVLTTLLPKAAKLLEGVATTEGCLLLESCSMVGADLLWGLSTSKEGAPLLFDTTAGASGATFNAGFGAGLSKEEMFDCPNAALPAAGEEDVAGPLLIPKKLDERAVPEELLAAAGPAPNR